MKLICSQQPSIKLIIIIATMVLYNESNHCTKITFAGRELAINEIICIIFWSAQEQLSIWNERQIFLYLTLTSS